MNYTRTRCHNEKTNINALLNYGACMEKTKKINEILIVHSPFIVFTLCIKVPLHFASDQSM